MERFEDQAKSGSKSFWKHVLRFARDEDGTATIEFIIWVPLFAALMAFTINLSMIFFRESEMLRVVQDGNRSFSLGRLDSATEVQDYVRTRVFSLSPNMTVATTISGGFVTTNLKAPVSDFLPVKLGTSLFDGVNVSVNARHIVEF